MTRRHPAVGGFCLVVAAGAFAWAATAYMALPRDGKVQRIGERIIAGDGFAPEVLTRWADRLDASLASTCDARHLTHALFVQMRAVEIERERGDLAAIDRRIDGARRAVVHTLGCAPTHSFAWLALYWLDSVRLGYEPALQRFLEQSYRTGPRETWVAARRNPLAMSVFEDLSPDGQERAIAEFVDLVHVVQLDLAAELFRTLGPDLQARIVPRLAEVPLDLRRHFARKLERRGVEVSLPGVAPRVERPWHR
jgi:hypothetical protein